MAGEGIEATSKLLDSSHLEIKGKSPSFVCISCTPITVNNYYNIHSVISGEFFSMDCFVMGHWCRWYSWQPVQLFIFIQSVEGLVLLPDNLSDVDGPIKRALRAHGKKGVGKHGLLFATAGDKGLIRVWSSESSGPPCLCSCGRLAKGSAESAKMVEEGEGEEEQRDKEREASSHAYTGLHLCQSLRALCGVTHDHHIVLYDLPQLSQRKQVSGYCTHPCSWPSSLVPRSSPRFSMLHAENIRGFGRQSPSCH